jgi:hypothetical protein
MQNNSSKLTLSSLTNEFLNVSYIRLVIFLSISFKYYFFYKDCIFPKYPIFQLLGKKRCGERNSGRKFWKKWRCGREIIGENFGKRENM